MPGHELLIHDPQVPGVDLRRAEPVLGNLHDLRQTSEVVPSARRRPCASGRRCRRRRASSGTARRHRTLAGKTCARPAGSSPRSPPPSPPRRHPRGSPASPAPALAHRGMGWNMLRVDAVRNVQRVIELKASSSTPHRSGDMAMGRTRSCCSTASTSGGIGQWSTGAHIAMRTSGHSSGCITQVS